MPYYPLKSISLVFRFFCYAFFLLNSTISYALIIEAKAIEQHFSKLASFGLSKTETADLQRFYIARNYQPVWVTQESGSSLLETAFTFIASAESEGLDSHDYQLQQLLQLQQQASQSLPAAIDLEVHTTHALLTLARDLSRGRFTATKADQDWHTPQPDFDAVTFLSEAIKTNRLQQSLNDLSPKQPSYQLLKQTLARYQTLLSSHTEWITIPSTPSIHPGTTSAIIPLIRQRIAQAYAADGIDEYHLAPTESAHYDDELVTAIQAFQAQHGLNTDGVIGRNTIRALNVPLDRKIRQLRINMERLRWLPRNLGERYVLVNTAGFRLTIVEKERSVLDMRIIVGRDYRSTPTFNGRLSHMILNPYWNIPDSIARKDLLPKQQSDPSHFASLNIKVFPNYNRDAEAIDPDTIDWQAIKHRFPYVLRQDPGKDNALGRIKFMFSNSFGIYLHDTPSKSLFQRDIRTFSSGCIRLEKPLEFAAFALGKQELPEKFLANLESGQTTTVHLPKPLPIYLVYITAWIDEQEKVHFSSDIYDRDTRALRYARW
ncbi:MAG: L,D-transpeptidase family protein [Nitrosomonas sp.]|uniref:L,D-transpeptidase family protein n=1 Tax=Nitrosomonas sp. TaxID=42353 RepID=UPI00273266BA|nr:L,D-transpeptidase family protein [Nitrosomonas sp.]MDP3664256.1 L,D-transpeptidase family protein [Nitrosomonas sp.]MDZ4106584.1 L,D-transpeptidase family protein [Nitrosomonas sp.]